LKQDIMAYIASSYGEAMEVSTDSADLARIIETLSETDGEVEEEKNSDEPEIDETDSGIVRLANQLIIEAFQRGASDIHVEPDGSKNPCGIRLRIDGDCVKFMEIPGVHRNALVQRLKIMATLDISERRKPQDGKIRFKWSKGVIELRVATIPTANQNEDVVMRILAGSKPLPLDKMGFSEKNLANFKTIVQKPYGICLVVGPTGSGKTTTLHSALGFINTEDMKIWTAEDPVEITQRGLRQVQVQPKIEFTFAAAMRSFLRADPDVIMVGEMRDHETAAIGIEASLTGHLVDAAHELGARDDHASPRHGDRSVQLRRRTPRHHGAAPDPNALYEMQSGLSPERRRVGRDHGNLWPRIFRRPGHQVLARLHALQPEGLLGV
jgi:type II secretory ATPase GspE/PulE/Tfp pilus assembly ATPase PilB-like protein